MVDALCVRIRSSWSRTLTVALAGVCLVGGAATAVRGEERLVRRYDQSNGLPAPPVFALAQDSAGFLWIGTSGGLLRFDGREFRAWGRDQLQGAVNLIATGPGAEVVARRSGDDSVYRIVFDGVEPLAGLDGEPLRDVRDACFDRHGQLWLALADRIVRWRQGGPDLQVGPAALGGMRPRRIYSSHNGELLVVTDAAVWRMLADSSIEQVVSITGIIDVQPHPGGALFLLRYDGHDRWELLRLLNGDLATLLRLPDRGTDLVLRGQVLWVSFAQGLVVVEPEQHPRAVDDRQSFGGAGGPLLVDREGSLWLGNFVGLFQFPEPSTVIWTDRDGLPSRHTRFVTATSEGTWVATWGGLGQIDVSAGGAARAMHVTARGPLCRDAWDRLWALTRLDEGTDRVRAAVLERARGRSVVHPFPLPDPLVARCAAARDGTVWLSLGTQIFRTAATGGAPAFVSGMERGTGPVAGMTEDRAGTLWAGTLDGAVCRVPVTGLGHENAWRCDRLPGSAEVRQLAEMPSGTVWAATVSGIFRRRQQRWERVPGSLDLPSQWMLWLQPSRLGGVWVTGHGTVLRVRERLDLEAGWEVLEHPEAWHGVPTSGAEGVFEDEQATLWLATAAGAVRVPMEVRRGAPEAPPVKLVEVKVEGARQPLVGELELPPGRNHVELGFAALSYRDPGLVRYRIRSRRDEAWSGASVPSFRFVDLPPGVYEAAVIASLDGTRWSEEPARFAFRILAPWYARGWALVLFSFLAAALLYGVYRARLAVLLRLERQRTHIAMDLHDELGSGLGSIRLLADLAQEESVDAHRRAHILGRVAEMSTEMAGALGDIVWSLRSESAAADALGAQLAERGERLFTEGTTAFTTDFPEHWPSILLSPGVRRNIHRIVIEALHNAAKHSHADRVCLGFRVDNDRWRVWVEDNGKGMGSVAGPHFGLGLDSMRTRATDIGAEIAWSTPEGGGTRVEVCFRPRGHARRARGTRTQRSDRT